MKRHQPSFSACLALVCAGFITPSAGLASESPELGIHRAVELTWPSVAGEAYRVYRSIGDLDHFYPLAGPFGGDGGTLSFFDSARSSAPAFYKLHLVPPNPTPAELLAIQSRFRDGVQARDVDQIVAVFHPDVRFEFVPDNAPGNRDDLRNWFADLFRLFPDYTDSDGIALAGEDTVLIEHQGTGTHLGEWDLGPLGIVPPTGKIMRSPHLGLFSFEGDRCFNYTIYANNMEILVQLGLAPAPELPPLVPSIPIPAAEPSGLSPVEVVAQAQQHWNEHDLASYIALVEASADLLYAPFVVSMDRTEHAALLEWLWLAFPDLKSETARTIALAEPGWVLSEMIWRGTNTGSYFGLPPSGLPFELKVGQVSRVSAEGLMTYAHVYYDALTLLAQLGLLAPVEP